jgi:hypothetical protein
MHWELLFNKQANGYMQLNEQIEKDLFRTIYARVDAWRKEQSPPEEEIHRLYNESDTFITAKFKDYFSLNLH